jgi:hypothetical protein
MSAECDECIASVCAVDSFCCEGSYDELCVSIAEQSAACGCAPAASCVHDVCAEGDWLDPACDPCAAAVCEVDGFCCTTAWDGTCVGRVAELCGTTCGS